MINKIIDGNKLVRKIGEGGFGEVWLTENVSTGKPLAVKIIDKSRSSHFDRELQSLMEYENGLLRINSQYLIPIYNVNQTQEFLYYFMPLADGPKGIDYNSDDWKPITLASLIEQKKYDTEWYSSERIKSLISPVLEGLKDLKSIGLSHRDIKPDNIIFFHGKPCIADVGLITSQDDYTRKGTSYYTPPVWYVESGGDADMYAVAVTLYCLMTANQPNLLSKPIYKWPPQGKESLSEYERREWIRIRNTIIFKATSDDTKSRFQNFQEFIDAIQNGDKGESKKYRRSLFIASVIILCITILLLVIEENEHYELESQIEVSPKNPVLQIKNRLKKDSLAEEIKLSRIKSSRVMYKMKGLDFIFDHINKDKLPNDDWLIYREYLEDTFAFFNYYCSILYPDVKLESGKTLYDHLESLIYFRNYENFLNSKRYNLFGSFKRVIEISRLKELNSLDSSSISIDELLNSNDLTSIILDINIGSVKDSILNLNGSRNTFEYTARKFNGSGAYSTALLIAQCYTNNKKSFDIINLEGQFAECLKKNMTSYEIFEDEIMNIEIFLEFISSFAYNWYVIEKNAFKGVEENPLDWFIQNGILNINISTTVNFSINESKGSFPIDLRALSDEISGNNNIYNPEFLPDNYDFFLGTFLGINFTDHIKRSPYLNIDRRRFWIPFYKRSNQHDRENILRLIQDETGVTDLSLPLRKKNNILIFRYPNEINTCILVDSPYLRSKQCSFLAELTDVCKSKLKDILRSRVKENSIKFK
tara:strand:+ start:301 stop:2583 length:2283 start_codon:yes stop_codon:yes gene_type:complete